MGQVAKGERSGMLKRHQLIHAAVVTATLLSAGQVAAKTLVYCSEASPETFNPMFGTADSTMDAAAKTIFNRLVEFKPGTTQVGPALAERWEVSQDSTVFTFYLRRGVRFHANKNFTPTRDFNADDVVYSFERQWKTDNPYHKLSNGSYEYFNALGLGTVLDTIEKVDDFTVRFRLKKPDVTFLSNIALDYLSILSLEQAQTLVAQGRGDLVDREPVGTGPFMLTAHQKDSQIRYRANPDYWNGKPPLDTLVFVITSEPTVRVAKLRAGECHVTTQPPPSSIADLQKDPNIKVLRQEGQNIGLLGFNVERATLSDKRVRQALAVAINKQGIIDAVYQGSGASARTIVPPMQLGSDKDTAGTQYDPAAAKKLLSEAGHSSGLTVNLWAMPVSRPYNPNARRMAELIQADWAAVGVKTNIVTFEWGDYLKRTARGEHDAFLLGGSSDNGDPDNLLSYILGCDGAKDGSNRSRWCNPAFESLLQEARRTTDQSRRVELYKQAQAIVREEAPVVPIAHSLVSIPVRANVRNYVLDPFGRQNFANVDLAE
jgi:dipeptide transport system substrate-binding protein